MYSKSDTPEWVIGLRSVIKDNCGAAYRIMEHRGKCKLDVRLSDGARKYKQLGIPWDRYHARRIQETVEQISANVEKVEKHLSLSKKLTLYNLWYNVNGLSSFNKPHTHPGSIVSGVYYISIPQNSGNIVFLNHQIGSFLGAYLGGVFYDMFGNYDYAWYLAIVLSFVATLLHLPIDEKPIKKEVTI